jgi:hypothetical protein
MAKHGDITTHDMFILNRACNPSYDSHMESTRIKHMSNQMRRWDPWNRSLHQPLHSRDAAQHMYKHVASSSLVVQESKSDIK